MLSEKKRYNGFCTQFTSNGLTEEISAQAYYTSVDLNTISTSTLTYASPIQIAIGNVKYEALCNGYPEITSVVENEACKILSYLIEKKNISEPYFSLINDGGFSIEFTFENSYYNITLYNDNIGTFYIKPQTSTPKGWDYTFDQLYTNVKSELDGL
jgi:hypothetical protein